MNAISQHLSRRVAKLGAGERNLHGKHLHFTGTQHQLALARHGDGAMRETCWVRKSQLVLLVDICILTNKEEAALVVHALGDAHLWISGLRTVDGLGAREQRSEAVEDDANPTRGVILFPKATRLPDGRGVIVGGGER